MEMDIKCENILQGDLVKASRDCDVPCDLVLLKTSDPDGKCFITTANLDGETNLKTLFVPKGFPNDVLMGNRKVKFDVFITKSTNPKCHSLQIGFIELVASNAKRRWPICIRSMDVWRLGHRFSGAKSRSRRSVIRCDGIDEHCH